MIRIEKNKKTKGISGENYIGIGRSGFQVSALGGWLWKKYVFGY